MDILNEDNPEFDLLVQCWRLIELGFYDDALQIYLICGEPFGPFAEFVEYMESDR